MVASAGFPADARCPLRSGAQIMTLKIVLLCVRSLFIFGIALALFLPLLADDIEVPLQEGCALLGVVLFFEGLRKTWTSLERLKGKGWVSSVGQNFFRRLGVPGGSFR